MSNFERVGDVFQRSVERSTRVKKRALAQEWRADVLVEGVREDLFFDRVQPHGGALPSTPEKSIVCPICQGVGWTSKKVSYGDPNFGKVFACVCTERMRSEKRRGKMLALCEYFGLQPGQVLQTFHRQVKGVQEAFQVARDTIVHIEAWAKQRAAVHHTSELPLPPAEWLVFLGPVGTGKTHLAMAIANASIDAGIETYFALVPDLLDHLRASYAPGADVVYDEVFEQMRNAQVLVLDDLGTQRSSAWANEKIFQLLNSRYNARRPTVITLNMNAWRYLDERIRSRFSDKGLVEIISLEQAQDYRCGQGKNSTRHRSGRGM